MEPGLHHLISERAYHLWNRDGRREGQAEHYWLSAEREVLAEISSRACTQSALDNSHRPQRKPAKVTAPRRTSLKRAGGTQGLRPSTWGITQSTARRSCCVAHRGDRRVPCCTQIGSAATCAAECVPACSLRQKAWNLG